MCDARDNCPSVANPDQCDRDKDGIGDACEECQAVLVEVPIYGLDRIASARPNIPLSGKPDTTTFTRHLGEKYYKLKDHFGNPRMIFSDIKLPTGQPRVM